MAYEKKQKKSFKPSFEKKSFDKKPSGFSKGFGEKRYSDRKRDFKPSGDFKRSFSDKPSFREKSDSRGDFKPRPDFKRSFDSKPSFRQSEEPRRDFYSKPDFRQRSENKEGFRPKPAFRERFSERPSFRPRSDSKEGFSPRKEFKPRSIREARRDKYRPIPKFGGAEFKEKPSFRGRSDFRERSNFRDKPNFRDRSSFRERPQFRDREDRQPRQDFKPRFEKRTYDQERKPFREEKREFRQEEQKPIESAFELKENYSELGDLRTRLMKRTREQVTEELSGKEIHLIKAINLIEDLDEIFNLLAEQVIDWHSMNFPELKRIVKENEDYLSAVYKIGAKKNFDKQNLDKTSLTNDKKNMILEKLSDSLGVDFEEDDSKQLQQLALTALNVKNQRSTLLKFLEEKMQQIMPNTSCVLGEILAAKMLARAGSLKKMATMPSSTLQVLGAEKALYSHLKTGSKSPKHGIIFQHPLLSNAKRDHRGKIAKIIAGKLSVATKMDYFSQKDDGQNLKVEMEKKIRELK